MGLTRLKLDLQMVWHQIINWPHQLNLDFIIPNEAFTFIHFSKLFYSFNFREYFPFLPEEALSTLIQGYE